MYTTILIMVILSVAVLLWFTADSVYQSHLRARDDHPTLFMITGMNGRYLNDRSRWMTIFRRQVVLVVLLFFAVFLAFQLQ